MGILDEMLDARQRYANLDAEEQRVEQQRALFPLVLQDARIKAQQNQMMLQSQIQEIAKRQQMLKDLESSRQERMKSQATDAGLIDESGTPVIHGMRESYNELLSQADTIRKNATSPEDFKRYDAAVKAASDLGEKMGKTQLEQQKYQTELKKQQAQSMTAMADAFEQGNFGAIDEIGKDFSYKTLKGLGMDRDASGHIVPTSNDVIQRLRLISERVLSDTVRETRHHNAVEESRQMAKDAVEAKAKEAETRFREAETARVWQGVEEKKNQSQDSGAQSSPGGPGGMLLQDRESGKKYSINQKSGRAWAMGEDGKWATINPNLVPANAQKVGSGTGVQGAREAVFTQRMMTSANEAMRDLENIVQLPATSSTGIFGGRQQGPGLLDATKEVMANKTTSQEVQSYNVMSTGFKRNLATIEAVGLMPSGMLTTQMDAVQWKEGDTNITKLQKIAQTRQILEQGLDIALSNPRVSDREKEKMKEIMDRLKEAVPFTVADTVRLSIAQNKHPKVTMKDVMKSRQLDAQESPSRTGQYSKEDLEFTARKHGLSVDEVKRRLGAQ